MTNFPPSVTESARQRARRIPLDYHRRATGLDRAKWLLAWLIGGTAAAYALWIVVGLFGGSSAAVRQLSPAPLASVHAAWEGDCAACHTPGVPLRQDAAGLSLVAGLLRGKAASGHAAADAKCSKCHAGAVHHAHQIAAEVQSCGECHPDHQGKTADLARVADATCTSCHGNIGAHRSGPSIFAGTDVNIASLAAHPPSRSLAAGDPGRLNFSHQQHMLPGQVPAGSKESLLNASKVKQLDCANCHQPDRAGQYMQPINYERHCALCHRDDLVLKGPVSGAIPHGLRAEAIHSVLIGLATAGKLGPPGLSPQRPLQPIPGKIPGQNLAQQLEPDLATAIQRAEALLAGGPATGERPKSAPASQPYCAKCHEFSDASTSTGRMSEIVPTALPAVWLKHARFDHAAHRAVKCVDCHDVTHPTDSAAIPHGLDNRRLLVPDVKTCARCHAPAGTSPTAGVRFDCTVCHQYHGRDGLTSLGGLSSRRDVAAIDITPVRLSRSLALPSFSGSASCASAGCHGKSFDGKTRNWQSAYSIWASEDPHRRAFDVLYAERSVEIYRNLTPGANRSINPPDDAAYISFLEKRCLGCHTTAEPSTAGARDASAFADGVACESCHGPANQWLHTHYLANFSPTANHAFQDTKSLKTRARVCLECHLGPKEAAGQKYDVSHELIAAGHPRLTFELDAYLANYPAHWNQSAKTEQHAEIWRSGQEVAVLLRGIKLALNVRDFRMVDFSNNDCFDCHHALATPQTPRSISAAARQFPGQARSGSWPIGNWSLESTVNMKDTRQKPAQLLARFLETREPAKLTWDEAVQSYLVIRAVLRDLPQDQAGRVDLAFAAIVLETELNQMAGATQYDSPNGFDPGRLAAPLSDAVKALRAIAPEAAGGPP